ncbi:hypothetical protein ACP4OV_023283 [Aristida adscensionis]
MASPPASSPWVVFLLFLAAAAAAAACLAAGASAARFVVENNCSDTVWPAAYVEAAAGSQSGLGVQLDPGQTWSFDAAAPAGGDGGSVMVWGRTGCSFDGAGHGRCETGDCAGELACRSPAADPTLTVGATDESNGFAFYSNYGTSVNVIAPGSNLPMEISCRSAGADSAPAAALRCTDAGCPADGEGASIKCDADGTYYLTFCPAP